MTSRRYGPLAYLPITRRPKLTWPGDARVALWVNPNIEFFGLDDVMPGNLNERVPREHAKIPNVRNWAVRDYGNRVGIWRIMEVLSRYGIRASAALNSEVCDHHPEIIEEAGRLGWELVGNNQTNALRLTEMDGSQERDAVRATIDRIEMASGKRPVGWLGAGLAETWDALPNIGRHGSGRIARLLTERRPRGPKAPQRVIARYSSNRRERKAAIIHRVGGMALCGGAIAESVTTITPCHRRWSEHSWDQGWRPPANGRCVGFSHSSRRLRMRFRHSRLCRSRQSLGGRRQWHFRLIRLSLRELGRCWGHARVCNGGRWDWRERN